MGSHQALNLLRKGYPLFVYDVNTEAVKKLTSQGAKNVSSPKELASQVNILVTMLPSSEHVDSVYRGENGIFKTVRKNALLLDSSTIDPIVARNVAADASSNGAIMMDCPVSGGTIGAEKGTLTFMVGGSKDAFERAKPILECMGTNIIHCGEVGAGQVVKVCNNLILGISMMAVSEAMNLGSKLGVDPKILASVINRSSGRCWSSDTYNPSPGVMEGVPSSRGYTGGFQTNLMKKDVGLAIQAARSQNIPLPLGILSYSGYELLSKADYGTHDFSSYHELLQKINNDEFLRQLIQQTGIPSQQTPEKQ